MFYGYEGLFLAAGAGYQQAGLNSAISPPACFVPPALPLNLSPFSAFSSPPKAPFSAQICEARGSLGPCLDTLVPSGSQHSPALRAVPGTPEAGNPVPQPFLCLLQAIPGIRSLGRVPFRGAAAQLWPHAVHCRGSWDQQPQVSVGDSSPISQPSPGHALPPAWWI